MESNSTETTTTRLMLVRLVRMFKASKTMKRLFTTKLMALLLTRTVADITEQSTELEFNTREKNDYEVGSRLKTGIQPPTHIH